MLNAVMIKDAVRLVGELRAADLKVASAESCTGGLIAAAFTSVAGSSEVFERGFVTYSNEAKSELLGVSPALIATQGAVSRDVARAMALGGLDHAHADICVAVTGIAGPGGGSATKPVGLVYLAAARRNRECIVEEKRFGDVGRNQVRELTVAAAFDLVRGMIADPDA
ncbi:conserved hypothetical protein [Candidatus Filomicrobium marinum]|uniref:CinA C-terminal domain-containing protein n=2 Tax=Filomicrobium TaxID=119044 RepID=A0A0D6JI59_9HYPH|nr:MULTISPECIES: CinA family protein [Filomicrobium]MCV0371557.1 CinA family protein [Filomicrobium sp.]CFX37865.1 conserved hypothetical protein [Candidatus Filomicrobium marinum]CPR21580.1 conserved hypothetical protein [Candidatus Filomicrobium marinum]SDP61873.1 nicotinamide-nucleotide amidase [Filomicrobium insigne]